MMAKYFISIRPQTDGTNIVHREGCPFLPDHRNRIFLGDFQSAGDASEEGSRFFRSPGDCLFCSGEHKHGSNKPEFSGTSAEPDLVSAKEAISFWESVFLCALN